MANKKNQNKLATKRNFRGNQHTVPKKRKIDSSNSLRFRKISSAEDAYLSSTPDPGDYFIVFHFGILKDMLNQIGCCPNCSEKNKLSFVDELPLRMGFAHKLSLSCQKCLWTMSSFTSKECSTILNVNTQGRRKFEVNVRTGISFREIGKGLGAIKTFSRCMNMYSFSEPCYRNINQDLFTAYEDAAHQSMSKAAEAVKKNCDDCTSGKQHHCMCRVSLDGAWQKRGHASLHGVVTAISDGKCLDRHVLSKHCKQCRIWDRKKDSKDYPKWKAVHVCNTNHEKSSGAMEGVGAVEIFRRSIDNHSLVYDEYLGDGDTSSFKEVLDSKPYEHIGIVPKKLECVGHVQKRLGTRLRNKVKEMKGTKTPLSGKGKLTEKVINSLQNFYGIAIRQNSDDLYQMKKAIGAILYHCTKFDDPVFRHRMCPTTKFSWCKFQKDKLNGTTTHKDKISLPKWIHEILQPIFVNLSSDELLSKCLHGSTQNSNEALNSMIWSKCPKSTFVQRPVLEIGVNAAVLAYNDGASGVLDVLEQFQFVLVLLVKCWRSKLIKSQ